MGIKKFPVWGRVCAGILAAAAAVTLTSGSDLPVKASDSESMEDIRDKMDQIAKDNEWRKQQIDDLEGDIENNEYRMELISQQIDGVKEELDVTSRLIAAKKDEIEQKQREIEAVEQSIADNELEIEKKRGEIADLQEQNRQNLEKFAKLARALYINDTSGTIPILNGSDDWYEYFMYSDVIKNIGGQNVKFMQRLMDSIQRQEDMIDELNRDIDKLEEDKVALNNDKAKLEKEKQEFEDQQAELERDAADKRNELYGLAADNESYQYRIDGLYIDMEAGNAALDELNAELEELIRKAQQNNASQIAYGDGFRWPLESNFTGITTFFGYDSWRNGNHGGIDIANGGIYGANIYAAQSGTVITVSNTCPHDYGKNWSCGCGGGFGNYIVVDHGGGLATLYAHCSAIYVSTGQFVEIGDAIGAVGTTGWSTGPHLHFEVRVNGSRVDPFNYSYQYV